MIPRNPRFAHALPGVKPFRMLWRTMKWILRHRIAVTVIFALLVALGVPFVAVFRPFLPWIAAGTAFVIAGLAIAAGSRFDAAYAGIIGLWFAVCALLFREMDPAVIALRAAAVAAYVLLHAVLLIGPWSRFLPSVIRAYKRRRHLGVAVFFLALFHASLVMNVYFGWNFTAAWTAVFPFFGALGLLILTVLAMTSWDWWQKHVPWRAWAILHGLLLAMYLAGLFSAQTVWSGIGGAPGWTVPASAAFLLFWVAVAPWGVAPHVMRVVNGWKQLHALIHIAFASLVLHVYFGAAQGASPVVRIAVLCLAGFVWVSHLAGWALKFVRGRKVRKQECDAEPWHDVCAFSELSHAGKRVEIHGVPLALFLHEGKALAFFGYCSHQKGPLWLGKIEHGYLTCPWHGWQFSVTDGSAPPGFHDRIPFFETKVVDGRVWVKIAKGSACVNYSCKGCRCRA